MRNDYVNTKTKLSKYLYPKHIICIALRVKTLKILKFTAVRLVITLFSVLSKPKQLKAAGEGIVLLVTQPRHVASVSCHDATPPLRASRFPLSESIIYSLSHMNTFNIYF